MQKTTRPATTPPEGTPVQSMPHAPAVPPEAPLPHYGDGAAPGASHPLEAAHLRIASAHRGLSCAPQEQVHVGFLASRERLLEGLAQALTQAPSFPASDAGADVEHLAAAYDSTPAEAAPVEALPATAARAVGWNEWYLDSHVAPVGIFLAQVGPAAPAAGRGRVDCTHRAAPRAPARPRGHAPCK